MLLPFRNSKDTMSKQLITQEYNLHFREKKLARVCIWKFPREFPHGVAVT